MKVSFSGVLCTGNVVLDILVRPVDEVRWGATAWVDSIEERLGGNGANTSLTVARFGVPVRLVSVVGDDAPGGQLLETLSSAGVDTDFVQRQPAPTPVTIALVNTAGDRAFLHRPGVVKAAFGAPIDFTPTLLEGISRYHLANVFALAAFRVHAAETLRRARAAGLTTSLDTGWDSRGRWIEDLEPCLPYVDLLFVNQEEARKLTGFHELSEAAHALLGGGAGEVVIKLGSQGCALCSPDGEFRVPAFDVEVVDTTGAGDCFAGGFLAALARGHTRHDAARYANAAGALAVRQLGASENLPAWDGLEAWIHTARSRG